MLQNIEACEWLAGALRSLEVPHLDPIYANMRAVCILPFSFVLFCFFFQILWGKAVNFKGLSGNLITLTEPC